MISYELLPCPFCGAEAKPVFSGSCNYVTCSDEDGCWCGMTCPTRTPEEAVRIWNRRTIDRSTCQTVECTVDHGSRSWGMRCTACGKEFEHVKPGFGWRHCPNCGAVVAEKE